MKYNQKWRVLIFKANMSLPLPGKGEKEGYPQRV